MKKNDNHVNKDNDHDKNNNTFPIHMQMISK